MNNANKQKTTPRIVPILANIERERERERELARFMLAVNYLPLNIKPDP